MLSDKELQEMKVEAIFAAYENFSPQEKTEIDDMIRKLINKDSCIKNFGKKSAIELLGMIGIFMVKKRANTA